MQTNIKLIHHKKNTIIKTNLMLIKIIALIKCKDEKVKKIL